MKIRLFIFVLTALLILSCSDNRTIKVDEKALHFSVNYNKNLKEITDDKFQKAWEDPEENLRINLLAFPFTDSVNNSNELLLRIIEAVISEKMLLTNEVIENFKIDLVEGSIGDSNSDLVKTINFSIQNSNFDTVLIKIYGKYNTGLVLLEYFYNSRIEESKININDYIKVKFE